MKRIALIGPTWRVDSPSTLNVAQLKRITTNNTGNMAFAYAISKQLGTSAPPLGWNADPAEIRERHDIVVLMAANQIQPSSKNMGALAALNTLLENCQLPIVVIGLGSQAPQGATMGDLDSRSLRLLHILRDRKAHISIRGSFTAAILEAHGVGNYAITGCPSNFLNKSARLGAELEAKFRNLGPIERLAINCDVRPGLKDIVPPLVRWLEEQNGAWISQIYPEISFLRHEADDSTLLKLKRWGRIMKPGSKQNFIANFLSAHCQYFVDVEQWMEYLLRFDFSTGTRLHGNMLAWQAGVPAVWIPHDARTAELIDVMALPSMDRKLMRPDMTIAEFIEKCVFDGALYDRQRLVLMKRYCELLAAAGIELSKDYAWLADPAAR